MYSVKLFLVLFVFSCVGMSGLCQTSDNWKKAEAEMESGNFGNAINFFTKCIEQDDAKYYAYYKRAFCYYEMKRFADAKADVKKALRIPKRNKDYEFIRGNSYWLYSLVISFRSNSPKSLRLMRKSAKYLNSSKLYSTLGFKEVELGKYKDAFKSLNHAIRLDSLNAWAYSNRAWAYLMTNELDKARNDVNISKRLDDQNPYVYLHSALIYIALTDYDSACQELEIANSLGFSSNMAPKKSLGISQLIEKYCK